MIQMMAELEANGKGEGSSEKRKRIVGVNSPIADGRKSHSRSRSGGIKIRQPSILVSSDEDTKGKRRNAIAEGQLKHASKEAAKLNAVKLEDVLKMLHDIADKANTGSSKTVASAEDPTTGKSSAVQNEEVERVKSEKNGKSDESDEEETDKLRVNRGCHFGGTRRENEIIEYMRQRLDHYMDMNGKKVKSLCQKRGIKWARKDKGAWELAKQDTKEFTRLMNGDEDGDADDADTETESTHEEPKDNGVRSDGSDDVLGK
ncbi:hypothetical protein CBR_g16933 [Chara braunii]|uniref:Uncharacterized protein n=1 Tax=Chara braunii TaxID=69332 RepID=A0A388KU59_CHABU|nr:hypothetical protein CBR_g16933 [Chara braunii]|eukprot:GBG73591.1 hypothetical protein CBR_g16933 [Chara braunii]